MGKYVLDTNLFFNMEPGLSLGTKTEEVVVAATSGMKHLKEKKEAEFFMPPRVVEEFLSFFENKEQKFLKEFLAQITVKSPDVSKIQFPASLFYKLVEDVRHRNYRGLAIAQEEAKKAAQSVIDEGKLDKKSFEIKVGGAIKTLRERFRQATRFGFLDSVADLDLIVLARELDAYLVSTDEGVVSWGRAFGVREMEASIFGKKLSHG
ncbi:RNA ligase partner protein [Candidatus Roizmanbacteria bacterium]|nr:RNA ligase partner protein [Candidatus Roizmanbacteria bacterium]